MPEIFANENFENETQNVQTGEQAAPEVKKEKEPHAPKANIFSQLHFIQQTIKVGKNSINEGENPGDSFAYRTLEDILAELKPILHEVGCDLTLDFTPVAIGNSIWCTAKARLFNEEGQSLETSAAAMVNTGAMANKYPSQEALACGTMARKSALAGLLLLDDTTADSQRRLIPGDIDHIAACKKAAAEVFATPAAAPAQKTVKTTKAVKETKEEKAAPAAPAAAVEKKEEVKAAEPAAPAAKTEEAKPAVAPEAKKAAQSEAAPAPAEEKKEEAKAAEPKAAEPKAPAAPALPQRPAAAATLPARAAAPAMPQRPAPMTEVEAPMFANGKPVLRQDSEAWQRQGILASVWTGTKASFLERLHATYHLEPETEKTFVEQFMPNAA